MKDEADRPLHPSSFIVHPSNEAYGSFAYAYDAALGERFFRAVRKHLTRALEQYRPNTKTHLDLACGTALAARFFEQRGFKSFGIDLSLPMLRVARARGARVAAGDIRALPARTAFGVITCLYDSLNHLKDESDLTDAFAAARRCMNARSIFLFDVNDPQIYPAVWGMTEPFVAEGPDYYLEMATQFDSRTRLGRAVVRGWAMSGGARVEIHEERRQRSYDRSEIARALDRAGLDAVDVADFDPYGESRRVKLFFTCIAKEHGRPPSR